MDDKHETRRVALLSQLAKSKLKKSEFASRIGVSRSYLSQILSPGFRFGEKAARAFEERIGLPEGTLDKNEGEALPPASVWDTPDSLRDDVYALVPRLDVGEQQQQLGKAVAPPLVFRADWLKKKSVSHRDQLRTCDVRGDSMSPHLEDGDVSLIDTGQKEIEDGSIYAIRYGQEIRLRRVNLRFDGGLIIRADNPKYPEETLSAIEAKQIEIVGLMIWRGGGTGAT